MHPSPIHSSLFHITLTGSALLLAADLIGRLAMFRRFHRSVSIDSLAVTLPIGLIAIAAITATISLGRFQYMLVPVIVIGTLRLLRPVEAAPETNSWVDWAALAGAWAFSLAIMAFVQPLADTNGQLVLPNRDLSYFALLAQEAPRAGVASQWAGVLGAQTQAAGVHSDIWYHWCPVWLTTAVHRLGALSAMDALPRVIAPVLHLVMITGLSAILRTATSWPPYRTLPAAAIGLLAMSWPPLTLLTELVRMIGKDVEPFVHWNATYQFSYKMEAALVFGTLAAWLRRHDHLALVLLFAAGVSAPHNVAGLSIATATLAGIGLIRRDYRMLRWGLAGVAVMMAGWVAVKLCGAGLPKTANASLVLKDPAQWVERAKRLMVRDIPVGLTMALVLLPGLVWLVRSTTLKDERLRALGWLGLAALLSCYPAYEFLLPTGERGHLTNYAHAVLIFPLAFMGLLAAAIASPAKWMRGACAGLMLLAVLIGTIDMRYDHSLALNDTRPFGLPELTRVQQIVKGGRIGFFAHTDRHWWIPGNSAITAIISSPCVRLNVIPDIDESANLGAFYGSQVPYALVPKRENEAPMGWSLRYAAKLGVRHIMVTPTDYLPDELKDRTRLVLEVPGLKLYEWN